jgi:L-alanine-DL-glutamate epimerase-like enolase superfamily enzyme
MTITNVDYVLLTSPWRNSTRSYGTVRIATEDGRVGLGEAYCGVNMPLACREAMGLMKTELIGKDAEEYEALVRHLERTVEYFDHGGMIFCLVGAVDWALHDLAAQRAELPLHRFLNPASSGALQPYASTGPGDMNVDQVAGELALRFDQGFRAAKIRVGCGQFTVEESIERALGILERGPPGMRVGVDAGQQIFHTSGLWDLATATRLVDALEGTGCMFLEDPLLIHDLEGYRALRDLNKVPIAGGEMFSEVEPFAQYFAAGAVQVGQPDACVVAGPRRMLEIGVLAKEYGVPLVTHGWAGPAAQMQNMHAALAMENCEMMERPVLNHPLLEETIGDHLILDDGWAIAPEKPGMGLELTQGTIDKYPFAGVQMMIS